MKDNSANVERHAAVPIKKGLAVSSSVLLASMLLMLTVGFIAGTRANEIQAAIAPIFGKKVDTSTLDFASVQKVYQTLKSEYDGEIDSSKLVNGASRGMVAALGDPYTIYMDSEEAGEFNKELTGEFSGIGAEIGIRSDQPTIVRPLPDSPAEKAGLRKGDVLLAVNDTVVLDLPVDKVVEQIRGEEGTTVKLKIKRGSEVKDITVTRQKITVSSVESRVEDGVGILKLSRFDSDTGRLAREAATRFKNESVSKVVLDLRDNGGGYVDAARDVAGLWLENKVVVTEKSGGKEIGKETSRGAALLKGINTIVLVNNGSASASEIVAGALQDYKVARLVGEKTFGKGSVQQVESLSDGGALKVTIAKWYTPNGRNITKEGIAPDKKVAITLSDIETDNDTQLKAALEMLR